MAENGKQIAERAQQNEGNTSAAALLLPTNTKTHTHIRSHPSTHVHSCIVDVFVACFLCLCNCTRVNMCKYFSHIDTLTSIETRQKLQLSTPVRKLPFDQTGKKTGYKYTDSY